MPIEEATTQAYASMLLEHLNINVELQTIDRQAFYDQMNAKPTEILFGGAGETSQLKVVAVWSDGSREDVTPLARFQTNNDQVATISLSTPTALAILTDVVQRSRITSQQQVQIQAREVHDHNGINGSDTQHQ